MVTRVKICCISSEDEACMAIQYGASAIGLVGKMPSGPGPISDELIRHIAKTVPPPIATFMLTSERSVEELGGTGRVHNWKLSRQIREGSKCPVFLAGGLNAENVRQAIEEVGPFAFDACSGVRTDGRLDREKLELFTIRALIRISHSFTV
jgi:phosphoribosylanthranilate isomerase